MFEKPQSTHVLGIEIDAFSFKGIAISYVRRKPKLEEAFDLPIEITSEGVKPLYIQEQKQEVDRLLDKHLCMTFLSPQDTLVRSLELKLKKEKDIDAVLAFQAEPILPYPIENALVDKIILSEDKEGYKITIVAARKDHVEQHITQWNALDVQPEVISAAPFALSLFSKQFAPCSSLCYVLHLGLAQSLCILTDHNKLVAAQNIPLGIDSLAFAYSQDKNCNLQTARLQFLAQNFLWPPSHVGPALERATETLRLSVTRTIYALAKQIKGRDGDLLLVTGPGSTIAGLTTSLCGSLNKTFLPIVEDASFGMKAANLQSYALPIGAALSALPKEKNQINFRQKEFAYPAPWKRLKQTIILYMLLCLGTAIALAIFGKTYIHYQEAEIKKQYIDVLNVMNKSYAEFERELIGKMPDRTLPAGEIIDISLLTAKEIEHRLNSLEKEIQATPQIFPLQPNVPAVSDVLAWLGTHPNFTARTKADNHTPTLQIESFNYIMVKRPEPTKKQEKYQVKVELEFSSQTPKMAREFHDALIAPNEMVDSKGEIKWSSNRDRYRTSFYLKDMTAYPTP